MLKLTAGRFLFGLIKLLKIILFVICGTSFPVLYLSMLVFFFNACTVTKQSEYFKTLNKDTTFTNFVANDFESKIVKGDRLAIIASSSSPVEDALFNGSTASSPSSVTPLGTGGGYTVRQDGTIFLHRIGKISAEGFTRKELATNIETRLLAFMKDPIVQISYLNHKITVLGEVVRPQIINLPEEQISLIDALVLSGDVTPNANRTAITVIREEGNTKKVKQVNLENSSLFTSPWYYVKPNDIILVSSDNDKYIKEEKRKKLQTTLSLVASVVTLGIIILDRVIK